MHVSWEKNDGMSHVSGDEMSELTNISNIIKVF